jgi:hypothetical protein
VDGRVKPGRDERKTASESSDLHGDLILKRIGSRPGMAGMKRLPGTNLSTTAFA